MRVRELMTREPVCCTPDMRVDTVARMMSTLDCGAIPVVGDLVRCMPLGIVTDRDIVTRVIAMGRDPREVAVRDCMTAPAITVAEDSMVHECLELLESSQIRRVLVLDERGTCSGIVSQADIARNATKRETGDLVREVSRRNGASALL
jgi:CBS domain-containing protein